MGYFLSLLCFCFLSISTVHATAIERVKIVEHFIYETYTGDTLGLTGLVGFYFDYYLLDNTFFAAGTSWAVEGAHSGYGTAFMGFGYDVYKTDRLRLFVKGMTGAGGHFKIPAAGGTAITYAAGATWVFSNPLSATLQLGQLKFPKGGYEVGTVSLGLSYHYNLLRSEH